MEKPIQPTQPTPRTSEFLYEFTIPDGKQLDVDEMISEMESAVTHPPEVDVHDKQVNVWIKGEGLEEDEATTLATECFNDHLHDGATDDRGTA